MSDWDRQEWDSDESWFWFVAYRDAMPPRRLDRIRTSAPGKIAPPLQQLLTWAKEGHWFERAKAWDAYVDQVRQAEKLAAVTQAARAAAEDEERLLIKEQRELVTRELGKILQTSLVTEAEVLRPNELNRMIENVIKLGRLERGESTENVHTDEVDLSGLSVDELRQYVELRRKATSR